MWVVYLDALLDEWSVEVKYSMSQLVVTVQKTDLGGFLGLCLSNQRTNRPKMHN